MNPPSRLRVFEDAADGWCAECRICGTWQSRSNPTSRKAQNLIAEHFRTEHAAKDRLGVVFIAWSDRDDNDGFYSGYWDGCRDLMVIEEMTNTPSIDAALDWARSRADKVRIRPHWDSGHSYSAGSSLIPGDLPLDGPPLS